MICRYAWAVASVVTLVLGVGCGTTSFSEGSADGGHDGGKRDSSTGSDSGGGVETGPAGPDARTLEAGKKDGGKSDGGKGSHDAGKRSCPTQAPTAGTPCEAVDDLLLCEYGTDPRYGCDPIFTCIASASSTSWTSVQSANSKAACMAQESPIGCPATWNDDTVPGTTCALGLVCQYPPNADCACEGLKLVCDVPPPSDVNCPVPRPRLGSSCTVPSANCNYGACADNKLGIELHCDGLSGLWAVGTSDCPETGATAM